MKRISYSDRLKDPRWQRKRLEVMERDEFCCQMCGDSKSTLHVHHKRYVNGRQPWEYELAELATVCETCHDDAHEVMDASQKVMATLDLGGSPQSAESAIALVAGFGGKSTEEFIGYSPECYMVGQIAIKLTSGYWTIHDLADLIELLDSYGASQVIRAAVASLHGEDAIPRPRRMGI